MEERLSEKDDFFLFSARRSCASLFLRLKFCGSGTRGRFMMTWMGSMQASVEFWKKDSQNE